MIRRFPAWPAALALIAIVASACAPDPSDGSSPSASAGSAPVAVDQVPASPREDVPSALTSIEGPGLPTPLIDPAEVRSGGPPPDGIPAIDEPRFLEASEADFLEESEPVLALEIDGDARAYPVQVMIWHEIVNDTVGGVPVSVTYCPLCNSAVAVERRLEDRVLTFGTSGMLYRSALVMYDRQTESLWSHFSAQAIAGVLTGEKLATLPVSTVSWSSWRDAHPGGLVLSRDTGFDRDYGQNPYPGYDDVDSPPFLFEGEIDGTLAPKERVVGFGLGSEPAAVRLDPLLETGVVEGTLAGRRVTVWALPGTASALDATEVPEGRDVGATGVFFSTVAGRELSFERSEEGFFDLETGTRWDIFGSALDGPLAGETLEALAHVDTFWFAWAAFAPDTKLLP